MSLERVPPLSESWDFYSDPTAIARYIAHRDQGVSRNSLLEEAEFFALLGEVKGQRCLDLGCGYGHYARALAGLGASVVGVDRSELMINEAVARGGGDSIRYILADIETVDVEKNFYDVIISNLAFHYLADVDSMFRRVFHWLRAGGRFVFTVEHPIFTASRREELWCDEDGKGRHWIMSDYFDEHDRWGYFGKKHHHTLTTWINGVLANGFSVTRIAEPQPSQAATAREAGLVEDLHRPPFLMVSCVKLAGRLI